MEKIVNFKPDYELYNEIIRVTRYGNLTYHEMYSILKEKDLVKDNGENDKI